MWKGCLGKSICQCCYGISEGKMLRKKMQVYPTPLSTGEKTRKNKTILEMHADHTNISKYLGGNIQKIFHILFPCSREQVYSSFVQHWINLDICFRRSQHLLTECYTPFECLDDTILVILLTFWMLESAAVYCTHNLFCTQTLTDLDILLPRF